MHASVAPTTRSGFASILIVDDHPLYRDALTAAVQKLYFDVKITTAGTLQAAMEQIERGCAPDLVMFDLKLPDVAGISGFMNLRDRLPDRPIVVISSLASPEIVQKLMAEGAAGFMPKDYSAQELGEALREVSAGRRFLPKDFQVAKPTSHSTGTEEFPNLVVNLTAQQKRVLRLICNGKPNKQIAFELDLAEATVKAHITALLRRLGVKNRTQAALLMESMQKRDGGMAPETQAFLAK